MDLNLQGKTALVTGGTAGIGLAIARSLAREGAEVIITGRGEEKTQAAVQEIVSDQVGLTVRGIVADVGSAAGVTQVIEQLPQVEILVNNLGIYEAKPFAEITDADWQRIFEVNVMSGVRLSRHYFAGMLEKNWGRIVFISSESAIQTPPEMIHYGLTKTCQLALMRGLAELTKGTAVTVNSVMPGPTHSAGIVGFLREMSSDPQASDEEVIAEFFRLHRSSSLLQRLIDADEIAALVTYLASPLSSATNGAALRAEGGLLRSIV